MSRPIVSAEEARKLLDGIASTPWHVAPNDDPGAGEVQDADGYYVNAEGDADARIMAAAPDLAVTVVRLHDLLAAERGERAPEGWTFHHATCSWSTAEIKSTAFRVTGAFLDGSEPFIRWEWFAGRTFGAAPTALEAIEAADLAAKEPK